MCEILFMPGLKVDVNSKNRVQWQKDQDTKDFKQFQNIHYQLYSQIHNTIVKWFKDSRKAIQDDSEDKHLFNINLPEYHDDSLSHRVIDSMSDDSDLSDFDVKIPIRES